MQRYQLFLLTTLMLLKFVHPNTAGAALGDGELYGEDQVPCRRECVHGDTRVCHFRFVLEHYSVLGPACLSCPKNLTACDNVGCVTADGEERTILTVNRRMPGPSIQVCQGDTLVVDVRNLVEGTETTLHWHGLLQTGTPYMDGVPMLTQCPISAGTSFRYKFVAENLGTYFWHSHSGLQKMDGIVGSLVVRSPSDPSNVHYDLDLYDHTIMLQDWLHEMMAQKLPGPRNAAGRGQQPHNLLINGRGRFTDLKGERVALPLAQFVVQPGMRHRMRVVNAGCLECALQFAIQGHRLQVIASDGFPVQPVTVDSLVLLPGERYDFVLLAEQPIAAYWITLKALGECTPLQLYQEAVLRYNGTLQLEPDQSSPGYQEAPDGVIMSPLRAACGTGQNGVCIPQLSGQEVHASPDPVLTTKDVLKFTLGFKLYTFEHDELFLRTKDFQHKKYFVPPEAEEDGSTVQEGGVMGNHSLMLPPAPPLSQPEVLQEPNSDLTCDPAPQSHSQCFHVLHIPLNATVELLLLDQTEDGEDESHPMHLHGYKFYVLEDGLLPHTEAVPADLANPPNNPPMKDTVAIPGSGYARIRFAATNPGYWMLHCHMLFHMMTGMGVVLHVGEQADLPPVPEGFPRCGDWLPPFAKN